MALTAPPGEPRSQWGWMPALLYSLSRDHHFKLLCTQHLNTVLTRPEEVSVVVNESPVSRVQGLPSSKPWGCGSCVCFLLNGRGTHRLHYRVCGALGQLCGEEASPSPGEML